MPPPAEVRGGRLARTEDGPGVLRLRPRGRGTSRLNPAAPLEIAIAVVMREGRVLVARRSSESHLGGLWEFPGGKIEEGEAPVAAVERELLEETQLQAGEAEPLTVYVHSYPDRTVRLHAFLVREVLGDVRTDGGREWAWVLPGDLFAHPMPEANVAILRALAWRIGSPR